MAWDSDLLDDQKKAAMHIGKHARLLAGPGTGKTLTLTRRIAYLVSEKNISTEKILVLTFTRAAAFELRKRIIEILGEQQGSLVHVSTLHSFALKQLLRNSNLIDSIPRPLRIADDWEEREIILEDLKDILNCKIKDVKEKFNLLSADWQKLYADDKELENKDIDPGFLGAWRQHRKIFGYTLRSELIYQFKRALDQTENFSLESDFSHLLVDEYQDLNPCDLAVIYALRDKGIEVFAAGDDDQSIYGFRYANPDGIRNFIKEFDPSESLTLDTCVRCDRRIITLSLFVADLDPKRIKKPFNPIKNAEDGEVRILRFQNQDDEAESIAKICTFLINQKGYKQSEILILMRSDNKRAFSSVIEKALKKHNIPVAVPIEDPILDNKNGRLFLSSLRLLVDQNDSLALKTFLMLRKNSIGKKLFSNIYDLASKSNETFSQTFHRVTENPELIERFGSQIADEMKEIQNIINKYQAKIQSQANSSETNHLFNTLQSLADDIIIENNEDKAKILQFFKSLVVENNYIDLKELLQLLSSSIENAEQELDSESINIMTMHRAKGLTAKAVIIVGAEDEYIPGKQEGEEKENDERRLLYVSLSRAKHFLAVTYCENRKGQQKHTGRNRNRSNRTLTRFLRDAPIKPENGVTFVQHLLNQEVSS